MFGAYVFLILFFARANCVTIQQTPSLIANETVDITIKCSHDDSDLYVMLWYQQKSSSTVMALIGYSYGMNDPNYEDGFKDRFKLIRQRTEEGTLTISNLQTSDSAVYFCAARGQAFGNNPAYFGAGTKLTILEKGRSAESPKVEILNVSSTEVCNKEAVTLVCLASKFYPDHVSVSWDMNGEEMGNVATDNAATRDDKYYSISSRLQIPYQTWTTGKTFTCTVKFFNGTGYENHPASIRGPVDSGRNEAATFVKSGKTTMLAYGMIIVKSVIYGIFIIVVIKKQDFRGK